jgi:ABC-type transporter MlaC component
MKKTLFLLALSLLLITNVSAKRSSTKVKNMAQTTAKKSGKKIHWKKLEKNIDKRQKASIGRPGRDQQGFRKGRDRQSP